MIYLLSPKESSLTKTQASDTTTNELNKQKEKDTYYEVKTIMMPPGYKKKLTIKMEFDYTFRNILSFSQKVKNYF